MNLDGFSNRFDFLPNKRIDENHRKAKLIPQKVCYMLEFVNAIMKNVTYKRKKIQSPDRKDSQFKTAYYFSY